MAVVEKALVFFGNPTNPGNYNMCGIAGYQAEKMNKNIRVIKGNGNSSGRFLASVRKDNIIIDTESIRVTIRKKAFNLFDS